MSKNDNNNNKEKKKGEEIKKEVGERGGGAHIKKS